MKPWLCLLALSPILLADGTPYPVHVASTPDRAITALDGKRWVPALTALPVLSLSLFNGDFGAAVDAGAARFQLQMGALRKIYSQADACFWPNAPVSLYVGKSGEAWPWRRVLTGRISTFDRKDETLQISVAVDDEPFKADVLGQAYDGSGGPFGSADLKGRPKPLVMGLARNVEPVLIDAVSSIYQFSGYGPIESVDALFERASDFGAATGDFADYAALDAADIPAGRWATCLAEGLVRLGAPAYGVITGDVKGHLVGGVTPRRTGAMLEALADLAGVDPALLDSDSLDALDVRVPYDVNLSLQEQTSFLDLARRLALPCNHQAGVSLTGQFFVTRPDLLAGAEFTLDAQGRRAPQVVEAREAKTSPPYAKIVMGGERAWRVHSTSEIAFNSEIVDTGLYSEAATYREGQIVTMGDGSRWIYINPVPSAGNEPPNWPTESNAWWRNLTPPTRIANGQLLIDDTFDSPPWVLPAGAERVVWEQSRTGYAVTIPFVEDTDFRVLYQAGETQMPRGIPGKPLYFRATGQPWGTPGEPATWDGEPVTRDGEPVLVFDTPRATFTLELCAEVFNLLGVWQRREVLGTFDPATSQVTVTKPFIPSTWCLVSLSLGYPAQSGKSGAWTGIEPWESEYQPSAQVNGEIPDVQDAKIQCDWLGEPKQNLAATPKIIQLRHLVGAAADDRTDDSVWTKTLKYGASEGTLDSAGDANPGRLAITLFETTSIFTVTAEYEGVKTTKDIQITQQRDDAPNSGGSTGGGGGGGGGGATEPVSSNGSIGGTSSSTTPVWLGSVTIVCAAGGNITLTATYEFDTDKTNGFQSGYTQWYEWNGSADVALASEVVSSTAYDASQGSYGQGKCNPPVLTGYTPGSSYTFSLYGRSPASWFTHYFGQIAASST